MAEQSKIRIGLIGFGEVGTAVGLGLRSQGIQIVAYDAGYQTPPFAELIQKRARETGVPLLASVAEVVNASDLILAMVPGGVALSAATDAAAALKPGQMYADMGTATPPMKEQMAGLVEAAGAAFVDVAIMGSPHQDRHSVPCLASGKEAQRYRDTVSPFGMKATVVGDRPGRAAAIKMFRSIFMKGLEALCVEALMACKTWDVTEEVMQSINTSMEKMRFFPEHVNFLVTTDAIHAGRRAHEMDMVMETMKAVGIEPRITRGTAELIHWTASLGLKEHFGGEVPAHWEDVIDEIFRRTGKA
ncbi:MAG: NAD(P)-binding domain-containing protein [Sphingomonadaceae bacterium]